MCISVILDEDAGFGMRKRIWTAIGLHTALEDMALDPGHDHVLARARQVIVANIGDLDRDPSVHTTHTLEMELVIDEEEAAVDDETATEMEVVIVTLVTT